MPFRHVVMFQWAEHVGSDHVGRVRDALDELPAHIPEIRSYVHGPDVGVSAASWDYVVVADFDDVDGFRRYRDHPRHVVVIEELFTGNLAGRAAVQHLTPDVRSARDVSAAQMQALLAEPDVDLAGEIGEESDEDLLERARRAAEAEMQQMMAEPDDGG